MNSIQANEKGPRDSEEKLEITAMKPADWEEVSAIFAEGIATGNATFEVEVPPWSEWDREHRPDCRLIARCEGTMLSWAALSPVSSRCVYDGVYEVSVYVGRAWRGRGVGKRLLAALIEESERAGIWTLQAGILPENQASLVLHRSLGFREVGRRERIGQLLGVWRDVLLWERRSTAVGTAGAH